MHILLRRPVNDEQKEREESNLYENAKREDAHDQPWMMQTNDVADALIFCLTRPADMVVEKLVVTKLSRGTMD